VKLGERLGAFKGFRRNTLGPGLLAASSCPELLGDAQEKALDRKALPNSLLFRVRQWGPPGTQQETRGQRSRFVTNRNVFQSFP